ncbi:MAG: hypothetical protein WDM89_19435 [Rhizomicrobium sp.]
MRLFLAEYGTSVSPRFDLHLLLDVPKAIEAGNGEGGLALDGVIDQLDERVRGCPRHGWHTSARIAFV